MALARTIQTEWGFSVENAYSRVEAVSLIDKDKISFHIRSYSSPQNVPYFEEQVLNCSYDINGVNPIAQAYLHLKTLPEFEGAEDC